MESSRLMNKLTSSCNYQTISLIVISFSMICTDIHNQVSQLTSHHYSFIKILLLVL